MKKYLILVLMLLLTTGVYATELRKNVIAGTDYDASNSGIDSVTEAFITIDEAHEQIHEGNHFFLASYATINAGSSLSFCIEVPDSTKRVHMTYQVGTTGLTTTEFFEGSDLTMDGTEMTIQNSNRNSATTSIMTIEGNCTISNMGTLYSTQKFGVLDTPSKSLGGEYGRDNELIFKNNTKYVYRITSGSAGNVINYRAYWYETTPKN